MKWLFFPDCGKQLCNPSIPRGNRSLILLVCVGKASWEAKGGLFLGAGDESVCGEFCVFRQCVQSGARGTPKRKGLKNRGLLGPGRDASLLEVIKGELASGQLEPLRRWSGKHTMQYTDVVL